jgi:hypothetical protein
MKNEKTGRNRATWYLDAGMEVRGRGWTSFTNLPEKPKMELQHKEQFSAW